MEPFCLLMERTFSEFHPIYDMLQYHCRATLETNKLYDMKFNGKNLKRVRLGFVSGVRVWLVVKVKLGWVRDRVWFRTWKINTCYSSTGPMGPLTNLLSVDHSTSIEIINKNFKEVTMDNVDLAADMKVSR